MSLVPYDGSDISDSEEEGEEDRSSEMVATTINLKTENEPLNVQTSTLNLFNLPEPKHTTDETTPVEEQFDEFLAKKPTTFSSQEKKPVKITIPSLSDYSEDNDSTESPIKKFRTASNKGTGLFSVLPPPKGGGKATALIPQSVQKPKSVQKPLVPRIIEKKIEKSKQKVERILQDRGDNIEDDDEVTGDFFSLDRKDEDTLSAVNSLENQINISNDYNITPTVERYVSTTVPQAVHDQVYENQTIEQAQSSDLDDIALQKLIGPRGKRKLETDAVTSIVDLHETDIRLDNKEWFEQALLHGTGPEESTTVKAVPGGILKRKHQITYLAQQAKANEQQLKNTWAQNRATRQQTQSKYGF